MNTVEPEQWDTLSLCTQIAFRLMDGLPIAPEDIVKAESLGINIPFMAAMIGACYEDTDTGHESG